MVTLSVAIESNMDVIPFINVTEPYSSKLFYTNVGYRKGKSGYTGGIKDELFEYIDNELLWAISNSISDKAITSTNKYINETLITSQFRIGVAAVNFQLANKILERALFYCPEDTGQLKQSARIQAISDGGYAVIFDCPYAWFVHEFTWRDIHTDKNPHAIHKFLEVAYQEVLKEEGFL